MTDYRPGVKVRDVEHHYTNKNGEVKYYSVKRTELKTRKIVITDEDFDAFLAQLSLGKSPSEAAKNTKVALTSVTKKAMDKCLERFDLI